MTATLTPAGWVVDPDVVDERLDLPRVPSAQVDLLNARIAAGSNEFPVGTQIIRAEDGIVLTLQGIGSAARFLAPSADTTALAQAIAAAAGTANAAASRTALAATSGADMVGTAGGNTLARVLSSGENAVAPPAFVQPFIDICSIPGVPSNLAANQGTNGAAPHYTLTVTSGAAGATAVSVSESSLVAGLGSSLWACAVEFTDGTHAFNVVRANDGANGLTLHFPLLKAAAFISPVWDAPVGQHMTRRGYRAYAELAYGQNAAFCSATRWSGKNCFAFQPPKYQQVWVANAALTSYGRLNVNNVISSLEVQVSNANYADTTGRLQRAAIEPCGVDAGVHLIGHGFSGTWDTRGKRGFIETHFATTNGTSSTPANVGLADFNAYGTVNGVEGLIKTIRFKDFLQRQRISITGYDSVRLEFVSASNTAFFISAQETRLWLSDAPDGQLINKHALVVTCGDSWFEYGAPKDALVTTGHGYFSARLQELINADGGRGTVINKSRGGMTTLWALAWLDQYVLSLKPQVAIFHFFTNDGNLSAALATFQGPDGSTMNNRITSKEQYKANLALIASRCAERGIQAIFMLAAGTSSNSQAFNQLQWMRSINPGMQVDEAPAALSLELADATAYINVSGKRAAKAAAIGSNLVYAQGGAVGDSWVNPVSNRVTLLERLTYKFNAYDRNTVKIGVDANTDGLSDGITYQSYGVNTNTTLVPSISGGLQLLTATYNDAGSTGATRLRWDFSATVGRDYLLIVELEGCTPNGTLELFGSFFGGATSLGASASPIAVTTADATGKRLLYWRFSAISNAAPYFSVVCYGSRTSLPQTYVTGVKRINLIDLTDMAATTGLDQANTAAADLFALINGSLTTPAPTEVRLTDAGTTPTARVLKIVNGTVTVA